nr:DUF6350 family protein [Psychromicrobium silvestre]
MDLVKLTRGQSGQHGIPMPLWLQGALESAQLAIIVALLVMVPVGAVYFSGGFGNQGFDAAARLAGQAWLLIHAVPLQVEVLTGASSGDIQSGLLSLIPYGLTLIPFLFAWRAGRRLARASYADQLWQALLGALAVYAALGLATGYICSTANVSASLAAATLIPLLPIGLGLVVGARREAGSWGRLIGVDAVAWMAKSSQYSRWTGSYVWSALRAAFLAIVVLLAASALLFAVNLAVHWADVVSVYEGLKAGPMGSAALTLAQLGYFPNLAVWTMAWSSGSGFAFGVGSSIGPLGTVVPPVPAIPLLGALPVGQLSWGVLALILPVLAGVLAGWWFLREGENHFDEWLAIKVPQRWISASLSTLGLGLLVGACAGVFGAVMAWLSSGSAGFGRLTNLGPDPLTTAAWLACEVAIGVVLGHAVAPWLEGARQRSSLDEDFEPFEES